MIKIRLTLWPEGIEVDQRINNRPFLTYEHLTEKIE